MVRCTPIPKCSGYDNIFGKKKLVSEILRGRRILMLWHVLRNVLHCSPHPWAIADFFMRENPRNINVYPLMKGQR